MQLGKTIVFGHTPLREPLLETSRNAIRVSAPFKPLPGEFPEQYLEVTARFYYYIRH